MPLRYSNRDVAEVRFRNRPIERARHNGREITFEVVAPVQGEQLIWRADFSGVSGTTPRSQDWTLLIDDSSPDFAGGPPKTANMFVNGSNQLVLRSKREPAGWAGETGKYASAPAKFSGAWLGTFGYGSGWPTTGIKKHVFTPPFAIEMRMKYPAMPGGWGGGWLMPANKNNTSQGVAEIDFSEERMSVPTQYSGHQHWTGNDASSAIKVDNGAAYPYDVPPVTIEMRNTWHTLRCEVFASGTFALAPRYFLDDTFRGAGNPIGNAPDGAGALQTDIQLGLMIDWRQGPLGAWGSGAGSTGPYTPVTGVASTDVLTLASHGMANGQAHYLPGLIGGAGLTSTTEYFARDVTTNTWKVALTSGGAAVDFTTNITAGKLAKVGVNMPLDSDPGPWDLIIDYVEVYSLAGVTPP